MKNRGQIFYTFNTILKEKKRALFGLLIFVISLSQMQIKMNYFIMLCMIVSKPSVCVIHMYCLAFYPSAFSKNKFVDKN